MKNPNGPSIEEIDDRSDALRDQHEAPQHHFVYCGSSRGLCECGFPPDAAIHIRQPWPAPCPSRRNLEVLSRVFNQYQNLGVDDYTEINVWLKSWLAATQPAPTTAHQHESFSCPSNNCGECQRESAIEGKS